jgi:hypothetical protein
MEKVVQNIKISHHAKFKYFWSKEMLTFRICMFEWSLEIWKYFTGSGPLVSDRTHIAHHRPSRRVVTALTAESAQAWVIAAANAGVALIRRWGGFPPLSFSFLLPRHFCFASFSAAVLLLIISHLRPLLSSSPPLRVAATASLSRRPTVTDRTIYWATVLLSLLHHQLLPSQHLRPHHHA